MGGSIVKWGRAIHDLSSVELVAQQGYDSAELTVDQLMDMDGPQFQIEVPRLLGSGLSFEVFSAPLPSGVRVTEQGFNIYVWTEYLKRALDRVAALGGRRVVWSD